MNQNDLYSHQWSKKQYLYSTANIVYNSNDKRVTTYRHMNNNNNNDEDYENSEWGKQQEKRNNICWGSAVGGGNKQQRTINNMYRQQQQHSVAVGVVWLHLPGQQKQQGKGIVVRCCHVLLIGAVSNPNSLRPLTSSSSSSSSSAAAVLPPSIDSSSCRSTAKRQCIWQTWRGEIIHSCWEIQNDEKQQLTRHRVRHRWTQQRRT